MSEKDSEVQYINHHKQLRAHFVIYTDFESNLKQFQKPDKDNTDAENDNAD